MKKTGIGIDYSNICKDYNTMYLDRDNKDPDTSRCMEQVIAWMRDFLSDLLERFGYGIYHLNSDEALKIDEVASKRFLFYSLEKEITLQSFAVEKTYTQYANAAAWTAGNGDGMLIQNDEEGAGVYLYLAEDSELHRWVKEKLQDFSLDEVPLPA